jgi:type IV pilus assembly protein PilV
VSRGAGVISRNQAGAGLIEVAVALLVLSVGTLGLVKGQLAARQIAREALQRSEALLLGAGLLDQIRANPEAFLGYQSNDIGRVSFPEHDCAQQSCTAAQWGAWSLWKWLQEAAGGAVSDGRENPNDDPLFPRACLSAGAEVAELELSWLLVSSGSGRSCGEATPQAGIYVLSLTAHTGGLAL